MLERNTLVIITDQNSAYHGKTGVIVSASTWGDVQVYNVEIETPGAVICFAVRGEHLEVDDGPTFRVVTLIEGRMIAETTKDIWAWMEARGFAQIGAETSEKRRIELRGQPKFKGYSGPMWDGDAIRYECWKTYERLSE